MMVGSRALGVCATCRLRGLIKAKEVARTRACTVVPRISRAISAPRTLWTQSWVGASHSVRSRDLLPRPPRRFGRQKSTSAVHADPSPKEFATFVEALFITHQISWEEWRHAVFVNAQLKGEDEAVEGYMLGSNGKGLEESIRILRDWFGEEEAVPDDLLDDEEKVVWVQLFGEASLRDLDLKPEDMVVPPGAALNLTDEELSPEHYEDTLQELDKDANPDVHGELDGTASQQDGNEMLQQDISLAIANARSMSATADVPEDEQQDEDWGTLREHPLTLANRFGTYPTTVELPKQPYVEPVTGMLSQTANKSLSDVAQRVFGGPGLPYSTSTPSRGKLMQQKPISLNAAQATMSETEGNLFAAVIMPGIYASLMSTLTETRRRLGSEWAESLVRKAEAGTLRILDAGGAGAGVLAVRELLRAEWERMHEEAADASRSLATPDGRIGGLGASPPLGAATVLTGSHVLRQRASALLENTTFVPRLPDYVHTETMKARGRFDLVLAPHTIWPLREDYMRKAHVQNLWSLLSADGGVLLLLEKGVARGFEMVAGAREMLLETRIASPNAAGKPAEMTDIYTADNLKEAGMIIAPCTNHRSCPMYVPKGLVKGRRDICAFEQRYHRPPFLQNIFGTKGRNHEDVEFSYLSVMRGRDLRPSSAEPTSDETTTSRAFQGYETAALPDDDAAAQHALSRALPRLVLPPLKRKGHAILDVCTPAGTLERWTVPRSFSRQAYRDVRKARWGDLWALGAKTRVPRAPPSAKTRASPYGKERVSAGRGGEDVGEDGEVEELVGVDDEGKLVLRARRVTEAGEAGKMRSGRKIKGIRSKRDKKGDGGGRRKGRAEE